ncbi:MAG: lysylphosphatidylglycerol synthase transmembrane domain-containing protein [Candidatus Verstraetearchaeota archaeon]|nr:lysylphosphatidylglycerol synthase transmembrane domain-containing protein [Candidatus Verstraetearchaeota archaeon]
MRKLPVSPKKLMIIAGVVILLVYLYFVGFWQVVQIILTLDPRIAALAVLIDLLCIVLFTLSWKVLLMPPGMGFLRCVEVILVSIFGDMMIPTGSVSGELLRITMTTKKSRLSLGEATASVILHRLILAITFCGVLGVSIAFLLRTEAMPVSAYYSFIALGASMIALSVVGAFLAANSRKFERHICSFIRRTAPLFRRLKRDYDEGRSVERAVSTLCAFQGAISGSKRGNILASAAIATIRYFLVALIPYLMFYSLNYPISYWVVLTVSIFVSMVQLTPIGIPGLVGVIEVSMTGFFMGFGVPADIAASVTILSRLVMFWFELMVSGITASYVGVKVALENGKKGSEVV